MRDVTIEASAVRGWPKYPTTTLRELGLEEPPSRLIVEDDGSEVLYTYHVTYPAHGGWPTKYEYLGTVGSQPLWVLDN